METRRFNILIVEDNLGHQRLTEHALRRNRVPVSCAVVRDGEEALKYLTRKQPYDDASRCPRPDLILLDLNLPRRDGREVLGIILRDPSLRGIPVVIVSTSDREEDVRFALDLGAKAYISKSRGFDKFSEDISEVLKYATT